MFRLEVKRIWIKEYILLAVFILFIIKMAFFMKDAYYYQWKSDRETEFYTDYMKSIEGSWEKWKKEKIQKDCVDEKMLGMHYSVMEKISSDYAYVSQDKENRFFVSPNAWELYLRKINVDWSFIVFIIFLCIQTVTPDFTSGMIQSSRTSKMGRGRLIWMKVLIVLFTVLLCSISIFFLQMGIYASKYGLHCMDAPIQSCEHFADAAKNLSYGQACFLMLFLRSVGYMLFSMIIFCVASFAIHASYIFFSGIGLVFLPYYLFHELQYTRIKYMLPIPIGTLNGFEFLQGDCLNSDEVRVFREFSMSEIGMIYGVHILVTVICLLIAFWKLSGRKWKLWLYIKKRKNGMLFGCLIVCCICLCGCGKSAVSYENERIEGKKQISQKYAYIDDYQVYNIQTEEIIEIGESIMDSERILAIGNREILIARQETKGINTGEYTIELLDLDTYKRRTVLYFGKNADLDGLLGIEDIIHLDRWNTDNKAVSNMGINESVVYENGMLYYAYNDIVVRADCKSNEFEIVFQASNMNGIEIHAPYIFYLNGSFQLVRYNMENQEEIVMAQDVIGMWVDGQTIYMLREGQEGLYILENIYGEEQEWKETCMAEQMIIDFIWLYQGNILIESRNNIYLKKTDEQEMQLLYENFRESIIGMNETDFYTKEYDEQKPIIKKYPIKNGAVD